MLLLLGLSCASPQLPPPPRPPDTPALNPEAVAGVSDPALRELLSAHWEATMASSPLWASRLGDHRFDDRLGPVGPEARRAREALSAGWLARAEAMALDGADGVTLALFEQTLRDELAEAACRSAEWSLSANSNPLMLATEIAEVHDLASPSDGAALLARYRQLPEHIAASEADLRAGLEAGLSAEVEALRRVLAQLDAELALDPGARAIAAPLRAELRWPADREAAWRGQLSRVIEAEIVPALEGYADFLRGELLPAARPTDRPGLSYLPGGEDCYRALIRRHTTLELDPATIHQIGLDELERIHGELLELGRSTLGSEDLPELFARLRTDPSLYFDSAQAIEGAARAALASAEGAIPEAFGRLPQAPCEVRPIPDYEAPYTYVAYYMPVPPDGSRPGYYYVNTYRPETRPRYEAEVLAFHESIPGHHLQIAIANELPALPAFRRHMGMTAFVEGWALYAERLADELGGYSGDLDRLGMLSFDAWRASRLVVDTGLHAMGWSRQQAEDFLLENTPLAANNISNEVDRYITWPGQALAYKIGQRRILALRAEAEAALGEDFELAAFHDALLSGGAVSLPVLDAQIAAWIEAQVAAQ